MSENSCQFIIRLSTYLARWVELAKTDKNYDGLFELMIKELSQTAERYMEAHGQNLGVVKNNKAVLNKNVWSRNDHGCGQNTGDKRCQKCLKVGHIPSECSPITNGKEMRSSKPGHKSPDCCSSPAPPTKSFVGIQNREC